MPLALLEEPMTGGRARGLPVRRRHRTQPLINRLLVNQINRVNLLLKPCQQGKRGGRITLTQAPAKSTYRGVVQARHGQAIDSGRAHRVKIVGGRGRGLALVVGIATGTRAKPGTARAGHQLRPGAPGQGHGAGQDHGHGLVVVIKAHRRHRHQSNAKHCTACPAAQTGRTGSRSWPWSWAGAPGRTWSWPQTLDS